MSNPIQTKQHYELLDGLRGVAALMVIVYHLYECFPVDTWPIGHGYLAVDFFFVLSGFVIGYAYDDRWPKLGMGQFFCRRLVRLHPMVVFGVVWGLICFLLAGGIGWDGTKATTTALIIATLMGLFLIPQAPGAVGDVRGNQEMFSLNGPHWSLFFEYIGNIMYALFIRRFPTRVLALWTAALGVVFTWFFVSDIVGYGNVGVGWTLDGHNLWGGLLRMTFSYSLGLLMSRFRFYRSADLRLNLKRKTRRSLVEQRSGKTGRRPVKPTHTFWLCSLLIVAFLSVPFISIGEGATANCLYEVLCIMLVFPLVVWLAASGNTTDRRSTAVCSFLGDISYPLYAVHYPTMYIFYAYIGFPHTWRTPQECWPWMIALVVGNILLAYAALKLYDAPVRRWLSEKWLGNGECMG